MSKKEKFPTQKRIPNNICAGIRWLFEKRRLASHNLKKIASWEETVWSTNH